MNMNSRICVLTTGLLLVYGCFLVECVERSVSTSIAGMAELLKTEKLLVKSLSRHAIELEKKLKIIEKIIKQRREEISKAEQNIEVYLSNPLNAFSLIRRMHEDWQKISIYLIEPAGYEHIVDISSQRENLPTSVDLSEAVTAINRLQKTYDMKPADMVNGRLNGKQYDTRLSSLDAYTIGVVLLKQSEYFDASHWMYVAIQLYTEDDVYISVLEFEKQKILEQYAEAFVTLFRFKDALIVIDGALEKNPKDTRLLRRRGEILMQQKANIVPPTPYINPPITKHNSGCRGQFPHRLSKKLSCRYNTKTNAFLKLAPIKMEEVNLDPYMVRFHDVISDAEIKHLKEISRPGLRRATVYNDQQRKNLVVKTRTSQFSWLTDNATEITKRINNRITDITGFDMRGSEALQVMNYGLGGHYDTHYDFFDSSVDTEMMINHGNRMATMMFYMSDVDQGGATVFPLIDVVVKPQKGSAIMWYNLNNRGDVDWRTMHAACPVVVGSKWVCNKWIRERSQFRARPCPKE